MKNLLSLAIIGSAICLSALPSVAQKVLVATTVEGDRVEILSDRTTRLGKNIRFTSVISFSNLQSDRAIKALYVNYANCQNRTTRLVQTVRYDRRNQILSSVDFHSPKYRGPQPNWEYAQPGTVNGALLNQICPS